MQVLDRYLTKELFRTLLAVALVLILIIVSNRLVYYLAKAAEGAISGDIIFILLGLKSIQVSILLLPPSFFFAILLTLGRLYRDNEMAAMGSCGIGTARIYRALLYFTLPFALLVGGLTLYVSPWTVHQSSIVKLKGEESKGLQGLIPGRFNEFKKGDVIFYVEDISEDEKTLSNIFIQNRQHEALGIISSKSGYQYVDPETGDRFLVLVNGNRYVGTPGQADYSVVKFEKYAVRIQEKKQTRERGVKMEAIPTTELLVMDGAAAAAELQWRLSAPLSILVLGFLAVPMSKVDPREGRYGRLFVAVLVYVIYSNLSSVAQTLVEKGDIPVWLGIWWVHLLLVIVALGVMTKNVGMFWMIRSWQRRPTL